MFELYRGQRLARGEPIPAAHMPFADSMLEIDFAELSDVGRVRLGNEDYLGHVAPDTSEQARNHGWLFALADGVGGQEKGEVASRTAVETVLEGFREAARGSPLNSLLQSLVRKANTRVLDAGMSSGMATTLVACALRYDRAVIAHVGDSRCYLVRQKAAVVLTRDHTIANEHARLGLMSSEDVAEAETRHILSRSLGTELSELSSWVRRLCTSVMNQGGDWRSAIDALRPHTRRIWRSMSLVQRQRFVRHARAYWDVHRHRLAPEVQTQLSRLRAAGRLEIIAGRIVAAEQGEHAVTIKIVRRGQNTIETCSFARLVDCTT